MNAEHSTKEGKVNVALGDKEAALTKQAEIAGTSKTNLARVLILDGIERLEAGEFVFQRPAIVPATSKEGAAA